MLRGRSVPCAKCGDLDLDLRALCTAQMHCSSDELSMFRCIRAGAARGLNGISDWRSYRQSAAARHQRASVADRGGWAPVDSGHDSGCPREDLDLHERVFLRVVRVW